MADTATSRLRLLQIEQYTKDGTWGPEFNVGALDRVDEAFATSQIAVGANVTLTVNNFIADQARSLVLMLSGAGGFIVTVPAMDKPYLVVNDCAADVTITPLAGAGAEVRAGTAAWWYSDGTDGFVVDTTLDKINAPVAAVDLNGQRATNAADPVSAQDLATRSFVLSYGGPNAYESSLAAAASAAAALISENNAAASAASVNADDIFMNAFFLGTML